MPTRAQLINLHLIVASFFLPFAVMFLITGALYTISIKGSSVARQESVAITVPLPTELGPLVTAASAVLKQKGIAEPTGDASLRKVGGTVQLEWGGASRDVTFRQGASSTEAILEIKEHTAYRKLVQLHKAKGNVFAKAVSVVWAIGLALIFASGIPMAFASPKHRKIALISGALGFALFAAYYLLG